MANEYMRGCPECYMTQGWNSPLSKVPEGQFQCCVNPAHRFKLGDDGFLKSI